MRLISSALSSARRSARSARASASAARASTSSSRLAARSSASAVRCWLSASRSSVRCELGGERLLLRAALLELALGLPEARPGGARAPGWARCLRLDCAATLPSAPRAVSSTRCSRLRLLDLCMRCSAWRWRSSASRIRRSASSSGLSPSRGLSAAPASPARPAAPAAAIARARAEVSASGSGSASGAQARAQGRGLAAASGSAGGAGWARLRGCGRRGAALAAAPAASVPGAGWCMIVSRPSSLGVARPQPSGPPAHPASSPPSWPPSPELVLLLRLLLGLARLAPLRDRPPPLLARLGALRRARLARLRLLGFAWPGGARASTAPAWPSPRPWRPSSARRRPASPPALGLVALRLGLLRLPRFGLRRAAARACGRRGERRRPAARPARRRTRGRNRARVRLVSGAAGGGVASRLGTRASRAWNAEPSSAAAGVASAASPFGHAGARRCPPRTRPAPAHRAAEAGTSASRLSSHTAAANGPGVGREAKRELQASALAHPVAQLPLDLALDLAVADLAPAVAPLLAPRERELDLRPRALEVDASGDQRQALLLGASDQPLDLVAVEEELARAARDRGSRRPPADTAGCGGCAARPRRRRRRRTRRRAEPCPSAATSPRCRAARSRPRTSRRTRTCGPRAGWTRRRPMRAFSSPSSPSQSSRLATVQDRRSIPH